MSRTIYNNVLFVYVCISFFCCVLGLAGEAPLEIKGLDEQQIESLNLPEDTSPRLTVKEIRISGNTLIPTEALLQRMPLIYNASEQPLSTAESQYLYDFRTLHDIISEPGEPREVSSRTIQGLTQYILSVYQDKHYAGIYVYVPEEVLKGDEELVDGILPIKVLEAAVIKVSTKFFDANRTEVEEGYLLRSAVEDWSPVKPGGVANQKALDDFVNLLNLNPDRHVSAVVSKGPEPNTLALEYDIYETNPWHYFIQVDNSGTKDRQWAPRVGLINTNLLGIDDRFVAVYQVTPDKTADDNYSVFGSYDFPIIGPRLRLNLYGGHSEFDIHPESGPFSFIGGGTFYGGVLRYNLFQAEGWFFDVLGSLSHEESKITPSLFPQFFKSDAKMDLWGVGVDIHRRNANSNTSIGFNRVESMGGTDRADFIRARTAADPDFSIYSSSVNHNMYLDKNKVQQLRGTFRAIWTNDRLHPAKMTSFGGMYSVRGYEEYEIIADGGVLASLQYEFDLIRHIQKAEQEPDALASESKSENSFIRKVAPLAFIDYGRARIDGPLPTEKRREELISTGIGAILELGDNLVGAVYYGYPLEATDNTRTGKGRVNVSFMFRF